jgi:iron transport multicopper oxidase
MKIIIEVDGQNVQPLTVDSITIFAGQRYSFILHANKFIGNESNYWIHSLPGTMVNASKPFANNINSAILHYVGAKMIDPNTTKTVSNPLQEWRLQPLVNPAAPGVPTLGAADKNINLNITFNSTTSLWYVNNASFVPPPKPVLLQILSGAHTVQELYPAASIIELPSNSVIELSIPGGGMPGRNRSPVRFNVPLLWRGG